MNPEYDNFLKSLLSVCKFGLDVTPSAEEESGVRPFTISEEEFFSQLYETRPVERKISRWVRTATDLVCFVGPRGAGKTSVARSVLRSLSIQSVNKTWVCYVDLRAAQDIGEIRLEDVAAFEKSLHERLMNEYLTQLFPLRMHDGRSDPRLLLYNFLLGCDPKALPHELLVSLRQRRDESQGLFAAHQERDPGKTEDLVGWLDTMRRSPDGLALLTRLQCSLRIPHLVYAARHVLDFTRQVIWLDNIDALPPALQPLALSIVRKFSGLSAKHLVTVIAIREENVFRRYEPPELYDREGAPSHTRVQLELPKSSDDGIYYRSLDCPFVAPKNLWMILEKRLSFTHIRQRELAGKLQLRIETLMEARREISDHSEWERITNQIAEMAEELSDYSPILTELSYEQLKTFSLRVFGALIDHGAQFLANNSIRDFMIIHRDLLASIVGELSGAQSIKDIQRIESWVLSTLFFAWLRRTHRFQHAVTFDAVRAADEWYRNGTKSHGCSLPYLVVVALWNLSHSSQEMWEGVPQYRSATVGALIERLGVLGFEKREILETLYSLYFRRGEHGDFVEFRTTTLIGSPTDIKEENVVYLTYRAKSFVTLASTTFGYVAECVRQARREGSHPIPLLFGKSVKVDDLAVMTLPHLCDIATMHYTELKRIRECGALGRDGWLTQYRRWFAVPVLDIYSRPRLAAGPKIDGIRRPLQLEAMLCGVLRFVKHGSARGKMEQLLTAYSKEVEHLGSWTDAGRKVDFRGMLGLPDRT